jgi:hypothetical protein
MIYIFLDVDGVLNCDSTKERCLGCLGVEPEKVQHLKAIVEETNAEIILTSTWKYGWEPVHKERNDEFAVHLEAQLDAAGLTITGKTEDDGDNRGFGIIEWLRQHPACAWVVLDDIFYPDFKTLNIDSHLVLTSFDEGLTARAAQQAVEIIKEQLNPGNTDEKDED